MALISIISPNSLESSSDPESRFAGLAKAGQAYRDSGCYDNFDVISVEVPTLRADEYTGNPVQDLGSVNRHVADLVQSAIARDSFPVLAGGSCNHLTGVIGGLQKAYGPDTRIGLLWLDAHGDFNTPATSMSGMLGGMPVAVVAGLCHGSWRNAAGIVSPIPTDRIVMVDVRNLDPEEARLIRSTDVEVTAFGSGGDPSPIANAINRLAAKVDYIDLHIDADILDKSLQPNHPTAEPDGPGLDAVRAVIDLAFDTGKIATFAVVSVNPEGPEGEISLASGQAMLEAGLTRASRRDV